jgi:hypothetical protein
MKMYFYMLFRRREQCDWQKAKSDETHECEKGERERERATPMQKREQSWPLFDAGTSRWKDSWTSRGVALESYIWVRTFDGQRSINQWWNFALAKKKHTRGCIHGVSNQLGLYFNSN